ncbi:MAG TPA: penicillin-binding transpeptidase domain-containing protein, partial [Gaiellaceae bacterium]
LQSVCSITLGTQPVNPLEMTDAYATFARRGIHHAPQALAEVRGPRGVELGKLDTKGARAIPKETADLVNYTLQHVVTSGTGTAAALPDRPVAGKTGTAENYVDAWFCGYTPQLATCVWVGYPSREIPLLNVEGVPDMFGGTIPAEIWHDFMAGALAHTPAVPFVYPSSIPGQPSYPVSYSTSEPTTAPTTTTTETTTTTPAAPPAAPATPPPSPTTPPASGVLAANASSGHGHDNGHGHGPP